MRRYLIFAALAAICAPLNAENYYRLDDFDASYNKLKDAPAAQDSGNSLHPSATQKPFPREKSTKTPLDSSRRDITQNAQAIERAQNNYNMNYANAKPRHRRHFLLLGVSVGADIFTRDDIDKKRAGLDILARLGWHFQFSAHAFRASANLGVIAPLSSGLNTALSYNLNADFLLNVVHFDIFLGLGYGGEYFARKGFSHGVLINAGLSKSFGAHQLELGTRIPFYTQLSRESWRLNHNIDIVLNYNFKF